ncbi:MAG: OadG family protein [Akkermansia sp.]
MFCNEAVLLGLMDKLQLAIDGGEYQIVGILVVMFCLGLLAVILTFTAFIAVKINKNKQAKLAAASQANQASASKVAPASVVAAPPATAGALTPELVAVISAAVSTALAGANHRILEIKQTPYSGYSVSGRNEIFTSHSIRPTFSK